MSENKVKIYVNNNPKCNVKLFSAVKNEEWIMESFPFIDISGQGFINGSVKLKVFIGEKSIHEEEIHISENQLEKRVELENELTATESITIEIDGVPYIYKPQYTRVSGKVKYSDGTAVKRPIINITSKDVSIVGDEEGNFELILSEKELQIGIFDQNYSVSTLEVWMHNLDLSFQGNLDLVIDKLEVYRMRMWPGEQSDYIHFIPMSISRVNNVMKKGYTSELDLIMDHDVWVDLEKKNVKVYAGDDECRILSFTKVDDFLVEIEDKMYFRPSYVLSVPKIEDNKLIKLEIEAEVSVDNQFIKEYGQGYYYW